jgi:hypothetical protein
MSVVIFPQPLFAQNLPSLGDTEREALSPLMERKLGDQIMRDIRRDRDYLDDGPVTEYLNNFGSSLVAVRPEARSEANYDFFFFAVRDSTLNAFALPGGYIGVHSALVMAAQSESELAPGFPDSTGCGGAGGVGGAQEFGCVGSLADGRAGRGGAEATELQPGCRARG